MALGGRRADDGAKSWEAHGSDLSAKGGSQACAASEGAEQGRTMVA